MPQSDTLPTSASGAARLLVAEGDPDTRNLISTILQSHYSVETVPDGQAALDAIRRRAPELALIAAMQPPLDGLRLLRELRTQPATSTIPVVLLSRPEEEDFRSQGLQAGADDHLVRPFGARELLARVTFRLNASRLRRDAARPEPDPAARADPDAPPPGEERPHDPPLDLAAQTGPAALRAGGSSRDVTEGGRSDERSRERLRASEERLSLALEASGQGLWDWDIAADRVYMSPEYQELSGHTGSEVVSAFAFFRSLVHPDDFPAVAKTMEEHFRGRSARSIIEYRMKKKSGGYSWIRGVGRVIARDARGAPLRMIGVITDISEQKHVEEELRERQALLLEAERLARLGHWDGDLRSGRSHWSDEVYRILGYAPGSVTPGCEALLRAVAPEDRERIGEALNTTAKDGQSRRSEFQVSSPNGARRHIVGTVGLLRDARGVPARIIGTAQDITERKALEQALAEANRRKDDFLAVLSHELRNPLAAIRSSLHVLARTEPAGEQAQRMRGVIERQVMHLTRLVDDLLDVARIARGKIELQRERLELGDLVRRTLDDYRSSFALAGIQLEGPTAPVPLWLSGDATRIAQIVGNLLSNAAKFTPAGGRVHVAVEPDGNDAVVRVTDTGVGIAHELLGHLFEPFIQADRTLNRARGGLGLGLALVKGLAELHGGAATATSEGPGRGAELAVRLPLEIAAEQIVNQAETRPIQPRKVLIIEDNIDLADSLEEALELDGHEVEVAYDGPEGLAKARAFRPGLVLCDIGLPGMDGYEVARAFRADDTFEGTFLVALSGYALPEDLQRAKQAGFARHLAKPPTFEKLAEVLAAAPAAAPRPAAIAPEPQADTLP